jgi:glyoxalase family protein
MSDQILGIHHITAIASSAQANHDFYTRVLGMRLIKKTVNFDDPGTYHLYYGDETGTPGTIITFFPWEGAPHGTTGTGMVTEISYSVSATALAFWEERLRRFKIEAGEKTERLGEVYLPFKDPDGLNLTFVANTGSDERKGWTTKEVSGQNTVRGFFTASLSLKQIDETAKILTDILGYRIESHEGNRYRFINESITTANKIDLLELPDGKRGRASAGTNHHIAFRVADEKVQMAYREKALEKGLQITPKINRDYFYSLYFREPGGVLFEIATDNPGFTVDESLEALGTGLKLPDQLEPAREEIEEGLPQLIIN